MLGLRPRLKARNSLWDLVNKNPTHLHPSSSPSWKQPVEEGADGLPSLPFSLSLSSPPSPEQEPHHDHSIESSASFNMAPVSSTTPTFPCGLADQADDSQRKIRKEAGRRLVKNNMVGLQWRQTSGIRELYKADFRLAQDLSSPFQGIWATRPSNQDTV